jgi:hypothetical protein
MPGCTRAAPATKRSIATAALISSYVQTLYSGAPGRTLDKIRRGADHRDSVNPSQLNANIPGSTPSIDSVTVDFFTGLEAPSVSILDYCNRIVRYCRCSPECYIFALAYIRRAAAKGFPISELTVHRLLITAVVVAVKVRDDGHVNLGFYCRVGGVTHTDFLTMEIHFLMNIIDFRADVSLDEYLVTCNDAASAVLDSGQKAFDTSLAGDSDEYGLSETSDVAHHSEHTKKITSTFMKSLSSECGFFLPS